MAKGCCSSNVVRKIRIGKLVVGLTGLDDAFAAAARDFRPPGDAALGASLVEALRAAGNYIPQNETQQYAEALIALYAEFLDSRRSKK